jgi:outer membrane protein assembly factor BamB
MKRILVALAALAGACAGGDRKECSSSAGCGTGEYCAHTPDGDVCWPDESPPVISGVQVTCPEPCLRDSTLHVEAMVTDDHGVEAVSVSLDLEPARAVAMKKEGAVYSANVQIGAWPFDGFEREIVATVSATNEAKLEATATAVAGQRPVATRLRWVYDGAAQMSAPAVLSDGTVVVGLATRTEQVLAIGSNGERKWSATTGNGFITNAPSASADHIWIGSPDGTLYSLNLDGSPAEECSTGDAITGAPAIAGARAIAGSQAGVLVVADASGLCDRTGLPNPVFVVPGLDSRTKVIAAEGEKLRSFTLRTDGVLVEDWTGTPPAPVIGNVSAPFAISEDAVWTIAQNGNLNRTTAAASTTTLAAIPGASSGPIILADGSAVLGDSSGVLRRVGEGTPPPWTTSDTLSGEPAIGLALGGDVPSILVPTSTGRVHLVRQSDGKLVWSHKLSSTGAALQPPNIWTAAPTDLTSTAYIAGADGKLYAVIVDGALDRSAPWPKAFHDPRNTSNAGVDL